MTRVYFATNRNPVPTGVPGNFGTDLNPSPSMLSYGIVDIASTEEEENLGPENVQISNISTAGLIDEDIEAIMDGPDHLLLYIHGFDYRFREAAMRSAWLSEWFAGATPSVEASFMFFSWPSLGSLSREAYVTDMDRASRSSGAIRMWLLWLFELIGEFRDAKGENGRVTLLAHSMGNSALAHALPITVGTGPGLRPLPEVEGIFDAVILAASDVEADALSRPDRLALLEHVARYTGVYYNQQDIPLMTMSRWINGVARLGLDGPPDKPAFADRSFGFINCSAANPNNLDQPVDPERHQYYRLIPEVRDDICGTMTGLEASALPNRQFRSRLNYYRLNLRRRR